MQVLEIQRMNFSSKRKKDLQLKVVLYNTSYLSLKHRMVYQFLFKE